MPTMCLCASAALAQANPHVTGKAQKLAVSVAVPGGVSSATAGSQSPIAAQIAQMHSDNQQLRLDLIASVGKLSSLEGSISKASERADATSIRSSWFSFFTVVFSVAFGLVGQYFLIAINEA